MLCPTARHYFLGLEIPTPGVPSNCLGSGPGSLASVRLDARKPVARRRWFRDVPTSSEDKDPFACLGYAMLGCIGTDQDRLEPLVPGLSKDAMGQRPIARMKNARNVFEDEGVCSGLIDDAPELPNQVPANIRASH